MAAILFGSIGTIADTSELQRQSFNQAFKAHELDWHWDREMYLTMLKQSGGHQRIANYASSAGQTVDAEAIHKTKSKKFQESLAELQIPLRSGVLETMQSARKSGAKLAWVTTTSPENVALLIQALLPNIQATDFDLITNISNVKRSKPHKDAYVFALEKLGEPAENCIAIEDNLDGVEAAISAGLNCVAFPGENNAHHNFAKAQRLVSHLEFSELQKFLVNE
jgi:HAD superfamily hydrolase (TIGR01509 family)